MNMKRIVLIAAGWAGVALAQDKVTVPLSNPSQPATVRVRLLSGSINVTTGAANQVVVEVTGGSSSGRRRGPEPPAGMHRIEGGGGGIDAEEDHNTVTISGSMSRNNGNYNIQVPPNCSLKLSSVNGGEIQVTGVNGTIEASNTNGSVTLKNVSGPVVAHTLNGPITATLDRVASDKPMSFTSLNGKIDVSLPSDTKARMRLKTDNGEVYSDFDVKLEPDAAKPIVEDARGQGGKYRIRMERGIYGSINGGGPEFRFETMNGNILIHKK